MDLLTPYQYMRFAQRWNTGMRRNVQLSTVVRPDPFPQTKNLTLYDILKWWYGDKKRYDLFHTTDRAVWRAIRSELEKDSGRDLRGSGLLGDGFYLTPNARLAFLYGIKTGTPRVFRDRWVFAVLRCSIIKSQAKTLRYGLDFLFHDEPTMASIGQPLNGNDLVCREIVLKTRAARDSVSLRQIMMVAGEPYGDSARENVVAPYDKIFAHEPAVPARKGLLLYDTFLRDKPSEILPGFGIVYRVERYVRLIVFDGTIDTFLSNLRRGGSFLGTLQEMIRSLGTTVRIHFNRFTSSNRKTHAARCVLTEGHVVGYDPSKFFSDQGRREKTSPLTFLSTSKGSHVPVLVVPPFIADEKYSSVYAFAARATPKEFASFFSYAATVIGAVLSASFSGVRNCEPAVEAFCRRTRAAERGVYLNFHGGSVGWLHLRLDLLPAYYALDELLILDDARLPGLDALREDSEAAAERTKNEIDAEIKKRAMKKMLFAELKKK